MWAIYRKEMRQYLLTPLAWIVWACFLFLVGWAFNKFLEMAQDSAFMATAQGMSDQGLTEYIVTRYFNFVRFIVILVVPVFSMRLFAEEKQSGTLELLFTYPLTEGQMVFGKLLAALSVMCIMLGWTLPPILLASRYGAIDWAVLFCSYLGLVMMMLVGLAIGIFASSTTNSQVIAFISTFVTLLALWLAAPLTEKAQIGGPGWVSQALAWLARFVHELSIVDHYDNFSKGIINSSDVLYYLSMAAFFVFLTLRQLESRKWRGTS
jgi:ABC-2 type transport system permease protein